MEAFVVVHAANNAFGNWVEYNRMIGLGGWGGRNEKSGPYLYFDGNGKVIRDPRPGCGGSHGPQHEFVVQIRNSKHPITKAECQINGFIQRMSCTIRFVAPLKMYKFWPLLTVIKAKKHEPMIMTIKYGKGRVFHTLWDMLTIL